MTKIFGWIATHKFQAHSLAFLLIVLPSIGLYFATQLESAGWVWGLLGLAALGNLLAVLTP